MRPLAITVLVSTLASCSHAPPPLGKPLAETCADAARLFARDSRLNEVRKREAMAALKDRPFTWPVRVLAISGGHGSPEELGWLASADVECADYPRQDGAIGMRYIFTVYFDAARARAFTSLKIGTQVKLQGALSTYEGSGSFAAHAIAVE